MTCEDIPSFPAKHPDAVLDYAVDFEPDCARLWDAWTDYTLGQRIRVFVPSVPAGYEMEVTTAGRSGGRPPSFSTGGTVRDGSIVWTPRAISADSLLRTIPSAPTWEASGITISAEGLIGQRAVCKIAGGIDGQDYLIQITASCSDGLVIVKEAILPVRSHG